MKGLVFEVGKGWDLNAHYELEEPSYWHKYPKQITLQHCIITNNINYNWHIVSQKSQKIVGLLTPKIPIRRLVKVWNCGVRK